MAGSRLVTDRVLASPARVGLARLSVAPEDPEIPVAVGDNDPRLNGMLTAALAETLPTNACVRLVDGMAHRVTALDEGAPWIDGILLESGNAGDIRSIASVIQRPYTTPLDLPVGRTLFLGLTGLLSDEVPAPGTGYRWFVLAARRIDATHFIFSPAMPIRLAFS